MRRYILRRRDFSQYPFQYTTDRAGNEQLLKPGYTFTFAIEPPRGDFAFLHVHIHREFAAECETRWGIPLSDMIRLAGKAMDAWFLGTPVPEDHFNGRDMLKVDAAWYPHDEQGVPSLALYPYRWEASVDEPWPFENGEMISPLPVESQPVLPPLADTRPRIVFGFTLDVFPGNLILGYNQFKRKMADAKVDAVVNMAPLNELPANLYALFVPPELTEAAQQAAPVAQRFTLDTFLNHPAYSQVIAALQAQMVAPYPPDGEDSR